MLELFGQQETSVLGLASMLDTEKIPFRRVVRLRPGIGAPIVIAGAELGDRELQAQRGRRVLVLGGGPRFAERVLGAPATRRFGPCRVSLTPDLWPAHTLDVARACGISALRLPLAMYFAVPQPRHGRRLAVLSGDGGGPALPAAIQLSRCVWTSIDLGAAFANVLAEEPHSDTSEDEPLEHPRLRGALQLAYYLVPEPLRRVVRARVYARLRRRIAADPDSHSTYPIDATGWLLLELLKSLLLRLTGLLVGLERWPAPYAAAAVLTHDLEPRRYAYTSGVRRLLQRPVSTPPPAFGLVAEPSRQLAPESWLRLRGHDVICHGRTHRSEPRRDRRALAAELTVARGSLEALLGRRVHGYRSPRLDRSPALVWALDRVGFRYDSSFPDVDRENLEHFGTGVRFNLPYRPLLRDDHGVRPSRCLELPLTAPDCIQPLFLGESETALRCAVQRKAAYIRQTGGLYCALVHAGVFGDADAARRERHLDAVLAALSDDDVWRAGVGEAVDWWCRREAVRLTVDGGAIVATNDGSEPIEALRIVVTSRRSRISRLLPALRPGERYTWPAPWLHAESPRIEASA